MITRPLALAVQHKLLVISVVGCLGAGGAAAAITSATSVPGPVLVPAAAASAVPVQPAGTAAGTAGKGAIVAGSAGAGGQATVTAPVTASSGHSLAADTGALAPAPARGTPPAAASPAKTGKPAGSPSSGSPAGSATPAPATVSCPSNQRLTDAEITWLMTEVSKTALSDPSVAPGAGIIEAQLQPLIGQNECAAQAQPIVGAMCQGPATRRTIDAMASQMSFLVKLVVGNPCNDNLATMLAQLGSYTSML